MRTGTPRWNRGACNHSSALAVSAFAAGSASGAQVTRFAVAALILLLLPPRPGWLAAFAVLYGLGNGVSTILRGTAVAEVYGRERYAELNGALAAPAVLAKAAAPLGLAALWTATGEPRAVYAGVLALFAVAAAGLVVTRRAVRRHAAAADGRG